MAEVDGPLLGHHEELMIPHKDNPTRRRDRARPSWSRFVVVVLLVPTSIFFILYLQWQSAFHTSEAAVEDAIPPLEAVEPARDLKILLHPEHHVSRRPAVRHFSWNVTKSTIAPDGVEKTVFLINSMITSSLE
jgi:hypothetical protein